MPAPYPRRDPVQGLARAVNRGSKGQAGGKFPGTSPVARSVRQSTSAPDSGLKEVYVETWDDSLADRGFDFITFDPA